MAKYDLAIIGAGPGGYVAAIRAAQLGLKTALIEKERVGGLCLNWGCVPSKALLWNAEVIHLFQRAEEFGITTSGLRFDLAKGVERSRQVVERTVKGVEFLLKRNKVDVISGAGRLHSPREIEVSPASPASLSGRQAGGPDGGSVEADHVIVATGAHARSIPGVDIDGKVVITSREALELKKAPESIVIVGGGPVGVEFAYLYRAYGSQVTIVEMLDRLLPAEDEEISQRLERAFEQQGIRSLTSARVLGVKVGKGGAAVQVSAGSGEEELSAGRVLMAVGMAASTEALGLDKLGLALEKGFVQIDERMQSSVPGIYAIGDVTGKLMLAHVASAQGVAAVEGIAGQEPAPLDYVKMPRATFCQPQVASIGLTEAQAREQGRSVKIGRFPFRANAKATALGQTEGVIKVVVDADGGDLLGCHMVGPDVTELLAEASLGTLMEVTAREVGLTVHAHPTLSESFKEAALGAYGQAIHFWREERQGT
jgi:dihydrolipoamide dehydrogenase